jgi:putative PEP-CTERM system TPR-repeat lipoprotein
MTMNRLLVLAVMTALAACSPRGEKLLERAEGSLARGEYRAAMIDLQNYLSDHPADARARAQLGIALLELGDANGAEAEIRKARELGAGDAELKVPECRLMASRSAFDRILAECRAGTGDAAADGELLIVRGGALLGLARNDEAVEEFRAAVTAQPDRLAAYQGLAVATLATSGTEAARKVMASAPDSVKDQPRYWTALGGLELRAGDLAAAERAFATGVERTGKGDPDDLDRLTALAGLTEVQLRQGNAQAAAATSQQLIEAAPKAPLAKILRAQAMAGAGDLAQARTLLEEVVSQRPEDVESRVLLGLVNFQLGNLGQAEMHLANVVSRQPDNVRAQRLLAEIRSRLLTPEEALEALKRSLVKAENDPGLLALASQLSLQGGDREAALAYLARVAASDAAKTPAGQLELAGGYLMAGELDRAVELLEAIPQAQDEAGIRRDTLLMTALLRQGKTGEAVTRAEALVARNPDSIPARNLAGAVYAAAGRTDAAREQFTAITRLNPDDAGAHISLARLDLVAGKPADAEQRFQRVLGKDGSNLVATLGMSAAAMARQDAKEAERWLLKAREDHPQSLDARLALSQFYLGRRDFGEARKVAEEAVKLAPEDASAANVLGLAQLGAGDSAAALDSFTRAVRAAPRAYGYSLNKARAHVQRRESGAALDTIDAVLKESPGLVPALVLGASTSLQFGQVERAAGYIERLRLAAPKSPIVPRLEGDLAMAQKRYKDAVADYARAADAARDTPLVVAQFNAARLAGLPQPQKVLESWLVQQPQDVPARIALAEHLNATGSTDQAIIEYEAALKVAPGNAALLNNLAVLYQEKGDARALPTAEQAYSAAPKNPAIQDTYAWLLVESGSVDKGLQLLRESARALANVPEAQYHLGAALAKKGEAAEARRVLEQVVAGPGPADVKAEARRVLEGLGK